MLFIVGAMARPHKTEPKKGLWAHTRTVCHLQYTSLHRTSLSLSKSLENSVFFSWCALWKLTITQNYKDVGGYKWVEILLSVQLNTLWTSLVKKAAKSAPTHLMAFLYPICLTQKGFTRWQVSSENLYSRITFHILFFVLQSMLPFVCCFWLIFFFFVPL